jgi:hypothetical protein
MSGQTLKIVYMKSPLSAANEAAGSHLGQISLANGISARKVKAVLAGWFNPTNESNPPLEI